MSPAVATVIDCVDLDAEVEFFVRSGFRMYLVTPADDPRRITVERDGAFVELRRSDENSPVGLVVCGDGSCAGVGERLVAPSGSTIETRARSAAVEVPDGCPGVSVVGGGEEGFGLGRAGMEYRDLLPDRWGGRFIASHIRITDGGDVADWVHFHRIRFQMIYVAAGWVDVVYEDQGEPFRMVAGDCVLQPPEIRHRVLRSSANFEVIEIGCPAEHDTIADHELALPTAVTAPSRVFDGQRFVRHIAADASTSTWIDPSMEVRDTGIGHATGGLAGAVVVSGTGSRPLVHDGEFVMVVGLSGTARIAIEGRPDVELDARGSIALPAGSVWRWAESSDDHDSLVVSLPADAVRPA